ncbi:transglycosylase domain-containing protein [Massilia niabensis]|uniref:Transglycosylase domain-containing protein n=1 Tax=Massilia niabensis TaxID=544910 RepID=A0ABW0L4E1_9BURK
MRRIGRAVLLLFSLLLAYLALAASWAGASANQLLVRQPTVQRMPLSPRQLDILLRIEDPTFFSHHGLSLTDGQGVATISSAVARELLLYGPGLTGFKGMLQGFYRGVFECCKKIDFGRDAMALVLDARVSKERQLAIYVASIYMGRHEGQQVRGLEAAALAYLGKPLDQAGDDEMAQLVTMIRAPNALHPVRKRAAYELRLARVRAVLAGRCQPAGWFDTTYAHCAS